jgi:hypothetical protein
VLVFWALNLALPMRWVGLGLLARVSRLRLHLLLKLLRQWVDKVLVLLLLKPLWSPRCSRLLVHLLVWLLLLVSPQYPKLLRLWLLLAK